MIKAHKDKNFIFTIIFLIVFSNLGSFISIFNDAEIGIQDKNEFPYIDHGCQFSKLEVAKKLIADEKNFWNDGIFLGRASSFINAYKKHAIQIYNIVKSSYSNSYEDLNFIRLQKNDWNKLEKISIDYAIIEKYK